MAFCGPWGVFYHIPKTGGSWVRQCLRDNIGDGHESGRPHGWLHPFEPDHPAQVYIKPPYFTFVRHPATWLRSFWNHTGTAKWTGRDAGDNHWAQLCWLTRPFGSEDWEEFAFNIATNLPGLASWFMGTYCLPNVDVGCMEDYPYSLKAVVPDLMCTKPKRNQATNKLPEITDAVKRMIEIKEPWLMRNFYAERKLGMHYIERDWEIDFDIAETGATVRAGLVGE